MANTVLYSGCTNGAVNYLRRTIILDVPVAWGQRIVLINKSAELTAQLIL